MNKKRIWEYVLIWEINDYPDNGWWTNYELIKTEEEVIERVNEITKNPLASISFCAKIFEEIEFESIETVTKWKIKY